MKQLNNHIKSGTFARVYLFYGTEAFLAGRWRDSLVQAIVPDDARDMNMEIFEGKISATDIINAAETPPFFADYRLIVIKDSGLFAAGRADDATGMAEFVKNIPDTSVLIFAETDVDKRGRLYKRINENGLVCEAKAPKEAELADWIVKLATKLGAQIKKPSAIHLVRNSGTDMQTLYNETAKLAAYGPGAEITAEDINILCAKSLEAKIFDLMRAIGNKDVSTATTYYANLITAKESPLMILAMVARQFRFCLQCGALAAKMSQKDIAAKLGLHPFAVREFIDAGHNFSRETMVAALKSCLETDFAIKSGKIGDVLGVEMLIVQISKVQ